MSSQMGPDVGIGFVWSLAVLLVGMAVLLRANDPHCAERENEEEERAGTKREG